MPLRHTQVQWHRSHQSPARGIRVGSGGEAPTRAGTTAVASVDVPGTQTAPKPDETLALARCAATHPANVVRCPAAWLPASSSTTTPPNAKACAACRHARSLRWKRFNGALVGRHDGQAVQTGPDLTRQLSAGSLVQCRRQLPAHSPRRNRSRGGASCVGVKR